MEKKENILIAEFMGRKFYAYKENSTYEKAFDTYSDCLNWIKENSLVGYIPQLNFREETGQFETSWSWLMPVVEKIESFYLHVQISSTNCFIHWMGAEPDDKKLLDFLQNFKGIDCDGKDKISTVYQAVVEFITAYNLTLSPLTKQTHGKP